MEASIEVEGEFVEVGLKVLRADAVECPSEPRFEVGSDGADDGKPAIHAGAALVHRERLVMVTASDQALELATVIAVYAIPGPKYPRAASRPDTRPLGASESAVPKHSL